MESHPEDALVLLELEGSGTEQMRWEREVGEDGKVGFGDEGWDRGGRYGGCEFKPTRGRAMKVVQRVGLETVSREEDELGTDHLSNPSGGSKPNVSL
jgi:hypothetical protein